MKCACTFYSFPHNRGTVRGRVLFFNYAVLRKLNIPDASGIGTSSAEICIWPIHPLLAPAAALGLKAGRSTRSTKTSEARSRSSRRRSQESIASAGRENISLCTKLYETPHNCLNHGGYGGGPKTTRRFCCVSECWKYCVESRGFKGSALQTRVKLTRQSGPSQKIVRRKI